MKIFQDSGYTKKWNIIETFDHSVVNICPLLCFFKIHSIGLFSVYLLKHVYHLYFFYFRTLEHCFSIFYRSIGLLQISSEFHVDWIHSTVNCTFSSCRPPISPLLFPPMAYYPYQISHTFHPPQSTSHWLQFSLNHRIPSSTKIYFFPKNMLSGCVLPIYSHTQILKMRSTEIKKMLLHRVQIWIFFYSFISIW